VSFYRMHMGKLFVSIVASLGWCVSLAQTGVFTYHNDVGRTGQNNSERILTPESVRSPSFQKLSTYNVDGDVYAQPLYVPGLAIAGKGIRNVVFIATEADSIYAFDADGGADPASPVLWHASLLDPAKGATPVSAVDLGCVAISPQIGITSTPVIDPIRKILYAETFSREAAGLVHRLHALDLATGARLPGSPVTIQAQTAVGSPNLRHFDPAHQLSRAGLLLSQGVVYVSYGSNCDKPPYQGWLFAYDARKLTLRGQFATAPVHGKAAIWMGGAAPAADANGNVFVATADGYFDSEAVPARELGNSILKLRLHRGGLALEDYFTPFDQLSLARHDGDLGSGGVLLLPQQPGAHLHLLVQAGKRGTLYVVDQFRMTTADQHFCTGCVSDRQIVEAIPDAVIGGVWGMPAYWNSRIYTGGSGDVLRVFSVRDGRVDATPASMAKTNCQYPGCGLSVSADGNSNGILWALQAGECASSEAAVLQAFSAVDLGTELYSSDQHGKRDDLGCGSRFAIPTVGDGRVFVGGSRQWSVFGLIEVHQAAVLQSGTAVNPRQGVR
jgi:hypothetical protein